MIAIDVEQSMKKMGNTVQTVMMRWMKNDNRKTKESNLEIERSQGSR